MFSCQHFGFSVHVLIYEIIIDEAIIIVQERKFKTALNLEFYWADFHGVKF